jgi:hypothetical protein
MSGSNHLASARSIDIFLRRSSIQQSCFKLRLLKKAEPILEIGVAETILTIDGSPWYIWM